jgi:hypothetical protein
LRIAQRLGDYTAEDAATRDDAASRRDNLAAQMTPAQIADAQRMAHDWKPKVNPPLK